MSVKLISKNIILNLSKPVTTELIENELKKNRFGEVLRWAITEINGNAYTVTCSYEIKV